MKIIRLYRRKRRGGGR